MSKLSPDRTDFHLLVEQIERGSEAATWQLVQQFSPYVYRVVRRRLERSLRQRFDSQDFVQMTWASFLLRDRDLSDFESTEQLQAYLAGIAANKVKIAARTHLERPTRNARREVGMDRVASDPPADREPTPSEVVAFREAWNLHLERQPAHHRKIVELRIAGLSMQAIADQLQLNERTVRRVLKSLCNDVAA